MNHPSNRPALEDLENLFAHHPPNTDKVARHARLRVAAYDFAEVIFEACPECADRSAALRSVRESLMWANASIALEGSDS